MTTTIKVHVGGRYVTTIEQFGKPEVKVHGDYPGSPNPGGDHYIYLPHPATGVFRISEEYLGEVPSNKTITLDEGPPSNNPITIDERAHGHE